MSGYKQGYSESKSPAYQLGKEHGMRDARIIGSCPQGVPIGPTPPTPEYPVMYMRGYEQFFNAATPHGTCSKCR